jgi:hypothetical protein
MGSMLITYICVAVVLEHPKLMLTESKQMTESLRKIYKASSDFIGDASFSAEQQVALKTRNLWLPLLADNPWEHLKDEPPKFTAHDIIDTIDAYVTEDRVINAIPIEDSDERIKHDNTVVQYSRAMAYLKHDNTVVQ